MLLPNQQAEIYLEKTRIGVMGIVHPNVLNAWKWMHPVAVF